MAGEAGSALAGIQASPDWRRQCRCAPEGAVAAPRNDVAGDAWATRPGNVAENFLCRVRWAEIETGDCEGDGEGQGVVSKEKKRKCRDLSTTRCALRSR